MVRRIEVTPQPAMKQAPPWLSTAGYVQKEYADFLD